MSRHQLLTNHLVAWLLSSTQRNWFRFYVQTNNMLRKVCFSFLVWFAFYMLLSSCHTFLFRCFAIITIVEGEATPGISLGVPITVKEVVLREIWTIMSDGSRLPKTVCHHIAFDKWYKSVLKSWRNIFWVCARVIDMFHIGIHVEHPLTVRIVIIIETIMINKQFKG